MTYVMKLMKSLPAFRVVDDDSSDKMTKGIEGNPHLRVPSTFIREENEALMQLILWIIRRIYIILGNLKMIFIVVWNSRDVFSKNLGVTGLL